MFPSLRSSALLALAGAGSLLFSGCYDDGPYYGRAAYYDRSGYDEGPGYYAGPGYYDDGPDVDFYYVGGRPYSRVYGPLVSRDGGYYYSHGGGYAVYDRGRSRARGDYRRSRTVVSNDYRGNSYNTTSARYRGASTYQAGTTYRGTTRGSYSTGTYPSGTYGRTVVRGAQPAPGRARVQVNTRQKKEPQ